VIVAIMFGAIAYQIATCMRFGWHWKAQSDAEYLADGIGLVLLAIALAVIALSRHTIVVHIEGPTSIERPDAPTDRVQA